jgi:hypothetical protein
MRFFLLSPVCQEEGTDLDCFVILKLFCVVSISETDGKGQGGQSGC